MSSKDTLKQEPYEILYRNVTLLLNSNLTLIKNFIYLKDERETWLLQSENIEVEKYKGLKT